MIETDLTFIRPLIASLMREPLARREWIVQGFGFIRTYFGPAENPKRFRLNVWNKALAVPNVSSIHTHPWDFASLIIAGGMSNIRYRESTHHTHHVAKMGTGVEGCGIDVESIKDVGLVQLRPEMYAPGDTYRQYADEIHETFYLDGTVTLNERTGDTGTALTYWPSGTNWVDARPRVALSSEVSETITHSLRKWFT